MLNAIVPNVNAEEKLLNRLNENLCNITKSKMNKRI